MIIRATVELFRYKLVGSIFVLACWPISDRAKFINELSQYGMKTTVSCDPSHINYHKPHKFEGVLYFSGENDELLNKVKGEYFSNWYKWIIISKTMPQFNHDLRYDADVVVLNETLLNDINGLITNYVTKEVENKRKIYYNTLRFHPRDGITINPWGFWTTEGIQLTHDKETILRRLNLKKHPLRIVAPIGQYPNDVYNRTFTEYLEDNRVPEQDSGIRCAYESSMLIIDSLNASDVLLQCKLWGTEVHNDSLLTKLAEFRADLGGGVLRILYPRLKRVDFTFSIWPFSVGFTYLADRQSSSNMFLEPFTAQVWWACLALTLILVAAQRITAKTPIEKEGAFMSVLATWLVQDFSAVPEGISGRWTFTVMSISAMLVHAYYTSAIVSALMSTGTGGPKNLKALGDSRYAIASEDYDHHRFMKFDVKTNLEDLEYLKRKKMHSKFYQPIERGAKLIEQGNTAYHSEYNHIYPHLRQFDDDKACKLSYVDTTPEIITFITTGYRGQYSEIFREKGAWLRECGLAKHILYRWQTRPPPCRAALLAERVNFGDVAPVLGLFSLGVMVSIVLLVLELFANKCRKMKVVPLDDGNVAED